MFDLIFRMHRPTASFVEAEGFDMRARMTRNLRVLDARELATQIHTSGYCVVSKFLEPHALTAFRKYGRALVDQSRGCVSLNGRPSFGECAISNLADDPDFCDLMRRVFVAGFARTAPPTDFYQVLRCLVGSSARLHSMNFHYDSYVVSALIPLEIPARGPAGDLLIIPNVRRIRGTYLLNVFDKLILDNKCSQRIMQWLVRTNRIGFARLRLVPGNLYIFWGYKSIHTNEACSESALRSTLIYHYANPHTDSVLNRVLKSRIHIGGKQVLYKWFGRRKSELST